MRPIIAVAAVSICLWCGIIWCAVSLTNQMAPAFLPGAQQTLHATLAKAERHVRKRLAFFRAKRWIPA